MARSWRPGQAIVRREVWRGRPYAAIPVLVVADDPGLLALYTPEGTPFGFDDDHWPAAPHPWRRYGRWQGHGVLTLQRPGDAYGVFVFWKGEPRRFAHWYLNLQAPFRRTGIGIDTLDHTLDLWSTDGRSWHWKDDEMLDLRVSQGCFTAGEAAAFRAEARRIEGELSERGPWWDEAWAAWEPDPAWVPAALPEGWTDA